MLSPQDHDILIGVQHDLAMLRNQLSEHMIEHVRSQENNRWLIGIAMGTMGLLSPIIGFAILRLFPA